MPNKKNNKSKEIFIINQFTNTPDLPGHTRQYEIAQYLVKKNLKVNIYASDFNLSLRQYTKLESLRRVKKEIIDGITLNWLWTSPYKKNNWLRKLNMLIFCFNLFYQLFIDCFKRIFSDKQLIIIASSPQLPAAFIAFLISKIFRKKLIFEVRDLWPQVLIDQGGFSEKNWQVMIFRLMEKFLYTCSYKIVVLSKGAIKYVKKRGAKSVEFIPNGPDTEIFNIENLNSNKKYKKSNKYFTILYAGAHGEANDLENILEAAKYLNNERILFIFLGDGICKKDLIKKANGMSNIIFEEPIPKKEMPYKIASCDALIISLKDIPLYRYGVSPNKLYDAYALGKPVISTIEGEVNDEINHYNLGVTAKPGDPLMLSKQIKKLYFMDVNKRKEMGQNGLILCKKIYSRAKTNKLYFKIIKRINS